MIRISAVGGYGEVGRNMTAVTVNDETVIVDCGFHMDNLITHVEGENLNQYSREDMIKHEVIPDDTEIRKLKVLAIVPSHGHLDHIAAIPFLESGYSCPIYATPYTAEVIKRQFKDNRFPKKNRIQKVSYGKQIKLSINFTLEFVHVTHSIPHSSIVVLHTPFGAVCYANDFKLDERPVLEEKTDAERLSEIGKNVAVLISECLYARKPGHTPSESTVKDELQSLMLKYDSKGIFITTFTSHIARITTIVQTAKAMGRKVLCLGRSLDKYLYCAKMAGVSNIIDEVEICPFKSQIKKRLQKFDDKTNYVVLMTGHQAEERAVLSSMVTGRLPSPFAPDDLFIFSCNTIPTESIIAARKVLEEKMARYHMNLFKDVHVSGHASQDDLRKLVQMLKPRAVIPSHGDEKMMKAYVDNVAAPLNQKVLLLRSGQHVDLE